ncbi:hypothetical protein B0H14DRAFT_276712 [Mycena olivaceomarginata]|nr:hypothetical protein B0H14DRAFT_276712 [Mycena olivaceomarginata]
MVYAFLLPVLSFLLSILSYGVLPYRAPLFPPFPTGVAKTKLLTRLQTMSSARGSGRSACRVYVQDGGLHRPRNGHRVAHRGDQRESVSGERAFFLFLLVCLCEREKSGL